MNVQQLIKANYQPVLLVVIAFLAMVLASSFYVSSIVNRQMLLIGAASMETTQARVDGGLTESELLFANMAQDITSLLLADKTNAEILHFLQSSNSYFNTERSPLPDFMKVYAFIRGEFLDGSGWQPPADYDPPKRPWHIGALQNHGKVFFSAPYLDAETGGMCISFSQEIRDQQGHSYGVLAMDLKLTRITDQVYGQQIAGNGYGVLVDDTMHFIAHRNPQLVGRSLNEAGGDYPKLAAQLAGSRTISALRFTDRDKTDSIVFFRPVFNNWHIGVIIPRSDYYDQVYTLTTILGLLGLVLMIALSAMLIRFRVEKMRSDEENQSKSSFLARMSHEMRTPMNAIIGMTGIARHSDDPARVDYCLTQIDHASKHLLGVINDVLDMSKIEAGKLELSLTTFALTDMLGQVETVVAHKIEEKHQRFLVNVDDDVPAVLVADRQRLAQIITNLVGNANKFTPEEGKIHLHIRRLGTEGERHLLQVEVRDTGIGISREQQMRLFRSFEQADGSTSRKYGGTGLGLAISKSIVALMGGEIRVNSDLGQGACFSFTLLAEAGELPAPLPEPETLPAADTSEAASVPGPIFAGKRLLLAEDVPLNREIVLALLDDTGLQIDCAENGQIACEMFAANPDTYDLIFMDIHMPEMDGYEATRRIRAMDLPQARTVPIVAMTANVFREDIEQCHAAGMNDHVGKPLQITDLTAKLHQYLYGTHHSAAAGI